MTKQKRLRGVPAAHLRRLFAGNPLRAHRRASFGKERGPGAWGEEDPIAIGDEDAAAPGDEDAAAGGGEELPSAPRGKAGRLRRIEQGEESYGDGSAGEQALRFYLQEMLEGAVESALARSERRLAAPVRLLISLSGFSPVTTILAYRLLRPERLLVISSQQTEASINVIGDYVVGPGKLRQSDFMHRACPPTDPYGIYRVVKDELDTPEQPGSAYAVIDITGGRKVMSATAALAAWQLKLDLCYIESDYDPERRQPVPGSDRLVLLGNPTTLFGDQEMHSALELFASGAFGAARQRYEELCDSLAQPGRARFMRALSDTYEAWCDLDLESLPARIGRAQEAMQNDRHEITRETASLIEGQLEFLVRLADGDRNSLLVCFYVLGQHYSEVGRHDFAALLFYRTIEGCLARRLERRAPGFSCDEPDYALLTHDVEGLRARYREIVAGLNKGSVTELPVSIGLFSAAVLLAALDDEILDPAELVDKKALSHLDHVTSVRNKSVLAHGYSPIGAGECSMMEAKSRQLLVAYWALEFNDQDVGPLCQGLRFIQTDR